MKNKRLWIMRHGEAENFAIDDHERRLSSYAKDQFQQVFEQLGTIDKDIDLIVCSDARRTMDTAKQWRNLLNYKNEILSSSNLYLASEFEILNFIQNDKKVQNAENILLIGHNPGISNFAIKLMKSKNHAFQGFPTGALVVMDLPILNWQKIDFELGSFIKFVYP